METPTGPADVVCPRCRAPLTTRFYGPCSACRDELVATIQRPPEDVSRPAFQPGMNVVPNQVATKE